jgi:hypothetical protein
LGEINIILNILETLKNAQPNVIFINSLHEQFCNRGGLSKKQLEGLYSKAEKTGLISPAKLATLEAIIKKNQPAISLISSQKLLNLKKKRIYRR